jgi:hypothetical protein
MELAGLEPATSWVRSSHSGTFQGAWLGHLRCSTRPPPTGDLLGAIQSHPNRPRRMVEPFGTCPPALPNTFPQHSVARLPLRQQIRDSIGANEITCSKAGLPGAHRSPPIRSHRSHTSDGSVRGGRNSRSSSHFSLHSIVCRPGGPYVSLPAEPRGQKLRAMLEVEEGARPREERKQQQRGDPRAHRGLSSRRSCRRVTPRPGT